MHGVRLGGRMARGLVAACAAVALVVAVGCGSDDNKSSSSGSGSSTASSGSTAASTTPAAKTPTGSPYHLAMIDDDPVQPEADLFDTAKLAVDSVNAAGGVNGRPLTIEHCSAQVNQNAAAACARKIVADTSIITTTGNFLANGAGSAPILDKGSVASLGNHPTQPEEYSCPSCFPLGYASLGGPLGEVTGLIDAAHAKNIGMLFIDVPAARAYVKLIEGAIKESGRTATFGKVIFVPPSQTNFAGVLAQFSAAKVDGIMAGIPASQIEAFLRATGQQGYDKPIGVAMSTTNFTILGKLPPAATKNLILNSAFHRTGVPLYDQIIKAQTDKGIPAGNDEAINAYLAVELFKNVAQGKPDIDRKGVIDAANALPPFDFGGLTGTIDYSKDQTFLGGAFKRLTPTVHYYKYAGDTKLEPAVQGDPAFDLFKAPS